MSLLKKNILSLNRKTTEVLHFNNILGLYEKNNSLTDDFLSFS